MCGIAAIVGFTETGKQRFNRIAQCAALLKHRGPDHQSFITEPGFAMAHARLSIIDLSEASNQPFTTHDGRFTTPNGSLKRHSYSESMGDVSARKRLCWLFEMVPALYFTGVCG